MSSVYCAPFEFGTLKKERRVLSAAYYISMEPLRGGILRISAEERITTLKLLNVSEAARQLEIGIQQLHRDIRAGRVRSPQVRLGRRVYFSEDEMKQLAAQYDEGKTDDYN